jgi:hypothetical protein
MCDMACWLIFVVWPRITMATSVTSFDLKCIHRHKFIQTFMSLFLFLENLMEARFFKIKLYDYLFDNMNDDEF